MSRTTGEKRCKFCKRLLLDERIPVCHRCRLEARNKAGQALSIGGITAAVAVSLNKLNDNSEDTRE